MFYTLGGTVLAGYAALLLGLYAAQRGLMYHASDARPLPGDVNLSGLTVVHPASADGLSLYGWWAPPASPDHPTLLYFHGNAGSLDDRADRLRHFLDRGYGVLMATYRYNAATGGKPSEAALIADGHALVGWLQERGIAKGRIVLYGESLGSGIAFALAAEGVGAAVVVEGAFDSIAAVAQAHYWYTPALWLVRDRFDSRSRARDTTLPVLIVHGGQDRVVGPSHAKRLFAAANMPKEFHLLPDAAHSDLYEHGMGDLLDRFLARHLTQINQ